MGKQLIPPRDGEVEEIALREALEERYLQYALSTITGAAGKKYCPDLAAASDS
jgi:topoisomerase-4 subunit A